MKFKIHNCDSIQTYVEDAAHVVIQIVSPKEKRFPKLPKNDKRLSSLRLKFSDFDEYVVGATLFSREMARSITTFVRTFEPSIETVIVHCEAGISRSPAVAAALDHYFNTKPSVDWFKKYIPNRLVFSTLVKELTGISKLIDTIIDGKV